MNNYINVNLYYLSNETNPRFVAITVLELKAKIFLKNRKNWEEIANLDLSELILTT